MAKRKSKRSSRSKTVRKKVVPVPMEFNPALERFEPKVPFDPADHTVYPQNPPVRDRKTDWKWIIAVLLLLILVIAFFFFVFKNPNPVINQTNVPKAFLSLITANSDNVINLR
ncbi:MAG: hypothetical protein Q8Q31_04730 [Nanoarchaeota archaeon]|nr:hypothetical protein [Nanoarchaeota archaeon]